MCRLRSYLRCTLTRGHNHFERKRQTPRKRRSFATRRLFRQIQFDCEPLQKWIQIRSCLRHGSQWINKDRLNYRSFRFISAFKIHNYCLYFITHLTEMLKMKYSIFVYSNIWMTNQPYEEREGEIYFHNIYSHFGIRIEIICNVT